MGWFFDNNKVDALSQHLCCGDFYSYTAHIVESNFEVARFVRKMGGGNVVLFFWQKEEKEGGKRELLVFNSFNYREKKIRSSKYIVARKKGFYHCCSCFYTSPMLLLSSFQPNNTSIVNVTSSIGKIKDLAWHPYTSWNNHSKSPPKQRPWKHIELL